MKLEPAAVALVSGWEHAALVTGLLPTFTSLLEQLTPRRRAAVTAAMCGWLVWHLHADDLTRWASTGAHVP